MNRGFVKKSLNLIKQTQSNGFAYEIKHLRSVGHPGFIAAKTLVFVVYPLHKMCPQFYGTTFYARIHDIVQIYL